MLNIKQITEKIKEYARELGFELVGITSAEKISDIEYYKSWVENGFAGEMDYLKRNIEKRENPELLLPGTKSIVCLGINYYQESNPNGFKFAKYALNDDYHFFLKEKIQSLFLQIKEIVPELEGRSYVDTAPILERALAKRSGLGWIGKNTLLISPSRGSYFLLGELFLNIELEYDEPIKKDFCGNCTRCIDACPTDAILEARTLNSNLCISYLTIESKDNIPDTLSEKFENNIFGCDICQDVCPWNKKFSVTAEISEMKPREWLNNMTLEQILEIKQEDFSAMFKNSPVKRSKYRGFIRNVIAAVTSLKTDKDVFKDILKRLAEHEDEIIKNQAIQALEKIVKQTDD